METDSAPGGHQLVNAYRTNKVDKMDLVAMAQEIQKVRALCGSLGTVLGDEMSCKDEIELFYLPHKDKPVY